MAASAPRGIRDAPAGDFELLAGGLTYPTGVDFDADGVAHVTEAGLPFGGAPAGGAVVRIERGRPVTVVAGLRPPVNGLAFHEGRLFVTQGGAPAEISRYSARYEYEGAAVAGLPGPGNYQANMPLFGPDGNLYFSQGAMTNSAVVGLDAYELGWLRRLPHAHDIPGLAVRLRGDNFATCDVLGAGDGLATTGAFHPFGSPSRPGERVPPGLPCTAAVMRCRPDGGGLELVAWGLRNAYGLRFVPDGRLLALDQGADDRGSRPIGNAPDLLFEVQPGRWYGWPDFIGGRPISDPEFTPDRGAHPGPLLADHHELPPPERALVEFPPHSAATKLDLAVTGPLRGRLVVALFGDERPMTAPAGDRAGRCLATVDPRTWRLSHLPAPGMARPIDVRCHPGDGLLYVVDFGEFEVTAGGVRAVPGSGALWRQRA
jgi:glucose/arabinose dehydrogenase